MKDEIKQANLDEDYNFDNTVNLSWRKFMYKWLLKDLLNLLNIFGIWMSLFFALLKMLSKFYNTFISLFKTQKYVFWCFGPKSKVCTFI